MLLVTWFCNTHIMYICNCNEFPFHCTLAKYIYMYVSKYILMCKYMLYVNVYNNFNSFLLLLCGSGKSEYYLVFSLAVLTRKLGNKMHLCLSSSFGFGLV